VFFIFYYIFGAGTTNNPTLSIFPFSTIFFFLIRSHVNHVRLWTMSICQQPDYYINRLVYMCYTLVHIRYTYLFLNQDRVKKKMQIADFVTRYSNNLLYRYNAHWVRLINSSRKSSKIKTTTHFETFWFCNKSHCATFGFHILSKYLRNMLKISKIF